MKNHFKLNWEFTPDWLKFLMIVLLVLGIFFRWVNLDQKFYWQDEAYTSLAISGYTVAELDQEVFNGHVIGNEALQKYQQVNVDRGIADTLNYLAKDDPHHPPLYYVMARVWAQVFGSSVVAIRSLSALISLLAFPCVYWLCLELFKSPLSGWIAIALISVSPFHVLYAQEAREYSLWTVTILLSSAALLRAMRLNTKISWLIYAFTLTLGLYSFLFSALVALGHGIYVVTTELFKFNRKITNYLIASFLGFLAFTPWILVLITHIQTAHHAVNWTFLKIDFLGLVNIWILNFSSIIFDFNLTQNAPFVIRLIRILCLILILYSFYFLCKKSPNNVKLFVLSIGGILALCLILPDLILGGRRSTVSRYLIPCYLSIQLALTYLLSTQLLATKFWQYKLWKSLITLVISAGILSCIVSYQANTWWTKNPVYNDPQKALIINQKERPLLVSTNYEFNRGKILALSRKLEPKVKLQLIEEPNIPKIPDGFTDIFVLNPSDTFRHNLELEPNYKIEFFDDESGNLWRLEKLDQ